MDQQGPQYAAIGPPRKDELQEWLAQADADYRALLESLDHDAPVTGRDLRDAIERLAAINDQRLYSFMAVIEEKFEELKAGVDLGRP